MSHYINPLHPAIRNTSQYSSLGGAVHGGSATQSLFHMPNRRRLPQILYNPSSKWDDQIGRLAHTHGIIFFDHMGHSKQGMKMMELYSAGARNSMAGAGDRVLASSGLQRITLYIRWPGYEEWIRPLDIYTPNGPMTRAELAFAVIQQFSRYFEKMQYFPVPVGSEWPISPNRGISLTQVVLLSISNTFENTWQADVAVDF